jgi:hypothetical protein
MWDAPEILTERYYGSVALAKGGLRSGALCLECRGLWGIGAGLVRRVRETRLIMPEKKRVLRGAQ